MKRLSKANKKVLLLAAREVCESSTALYSCLVLSTVFPPRGISFYGRELIKAYSNFFLGEGGGPIAWLTEPEIIKGYGMTHHDLSTRNTRVMMLLLFREVGQDLRGDE
jgi:hypothetical protein